MAGVEHTVAFNMVSMLDPRSSGPISSERFGVIVLY